MVGSQAIAGHATGDIVVSSREMLAERRISGRYRLVRRIGAGGMGQIFEAIDERLDRAVALKLLLPGNQAASARTRMVREARAAASLQHPGIVIVHDVGETEGGGVFIAMELVRGRSLREAAQEAPANDVLEWVVEVARTLATVHANGFVHRDVKPDNVMVRDGGRTVLLDLGLTKALESVAEQADAALRVTDTGEVLGSPAYLAPEQARGLRVDGRADQWALAVSAYELLSGQLPWAGDSHAVVLACILMDPPRPLQCASLPPELGSVLERALAKDPSKRFRSCAAFADALETTIQADRPALQDVNPRRGAGRRKHVGWTSVAVASVVAASIGVAWLTRC